MNIVKLSPSELLLAAQAGIMRHVENLKTGQGNWTHGSKEKYPWQVHIEGCCVEMALSKCLGLYWNGKGTRGQRDAGKDDVRGRPHHDAFLTLHPEDKDDVIYWHLTGENGVYLVRGWIYGRDGKKQNYWGDDAYQNRPAFFVPFEALRKPEEHSLWPTNQSTI